LFIPEVVVLVERKEGWRIYVGQGNRGMGMEVGMEMEMERWEDG